MAVNETIQQQRDGDNGEIVREPLSADARRASEKAADALANAAIKRLFERHEVDEFDEQNSVPLTVRPESTLSVRFTAEEFEHIRRQADQLGMEPTAYVRACVVTETPRVAELRELADKLPKMWDRFTG